VTPIDPLQDLLAPGAMIPSARRQALRERTARLVRRKRWQRRLRLAAAALLLYAAGAGTWAWLRPTPPAPEPEVAPIVDANPVPAPAKATTAPLALEWQAFDAAAADKPTAADKAAALVQAGKKYLHDNDDPGAALRCYRHALAGADADLLQVSPDDDWLIMALKMEKRKER
jgi:hypothetical protein